jgi:hypothetical protein
MSIFKKYMAILLVVGFSFPTIFQSIHVIEHHSQKNAECEHSCGPEKHQNNNQELPGTAYISKYQGTCAICNFHLNDLKFSESHFRMENTEDTHPLITVPQRSLHSYYSGLNQLLRAPPMA